MPDVVSRTDLENAKQDTQTIADVANGAADFGGDGLVHPRLGGNVKTVAKAIADMGDALAGGLSGDIYSSETTGRAAVADGDQFIVQDGSYLIRYERVSAGVVSTEIARWRNAEGQDEVVASLGDRLSECSGSTHTPNGAADMSGTDFGIQIPTGQSGTGAFIQCIWPFSGSGKTGQTVRLALLFEKSATHTRTLSLTMQVRIGASNANRTARVQQIDQGTLTVFLVDYELQGDETDLRPYTVLTGNATASTETTELIEFRPAYLEGSNRAETAADLTADAREEELRVGLRRDLTAHSGNKVGQDELVPAFQYFNGAEEAGDFAVRVPSGSVGNTTVMQVSLDVTNKYASGQKLRLKMVADESATFTRTVGNLAFQVQTSGGTANRTAETSLVQSGSRRVYIIDYTTQGDETHLKPFIQLQSGSATASDETLEITDLRVYLMSTPAEPNNATDAALDERVEQEVKRIGDRDYLFGLGDLKEEEHWLPQVFNGAVRVDPYTIRIPSGSVGNVTILQARWLFARTMEAGRKIRMKVRYTTSATFTRVLSSTPSFQVQLSGGDASRTPDSRSITQSGTTVIIDVEYTTQGDEVAIKPFFQVQSGAAAASDETITLDAVSCFYVSNDDDVFTVMDEVWEDRVAFNSTELKSAERTVAYDGVPAAVADVTRTIGATGADYTSPEAALAAISDAAANKRYELRVQPGVYQDDEWFDEDYVDFVGVDKRDCVIDFQQPNDTSAADIIQYSALYMRRTSRLEGLTIRARNARYAIHLESSKGGPDRLQELINCHIEHLGNDDATNNTWGSQNGIGSGLSSGQAVKIEGCTVIAKNHTAFSYHTNVDFVAPTLVELLNSSFLSHGTGAAVTVLPIGSFQPDKCRIEGCTLGGDIVYAISPWLPVTLAEQPANHAEVHVYGHGNSPAVFDNRDFGQALRITSATTGASSTVAISGDAVPLLFGDGTQDRHYTVDGSAGLSGYAYGWGDVSDTAVGPTSSVQITSLGKRLGDRTSSSRTLSVTVDGGSAIDIVFDQDYTAVSNSSLLSTIDTALGAAATADTFKPGQRYRPHFSDEEESLKNDSGTGLLMGMVLAFDGARDKVRAMTSTDSASLFAGVAWEDIPTGKRGRVKTRGWIHEDDVLRTDGGALTFADTFSVDASNPGKVAVGGSQGLMYAVRADAIEVAPK